MQHVVAFNFPNPLSLLGNVFNPFDWLSGAISGLAKSEVGMFEQSIISPPPQPPHNWVDYLYGNAVGVSGLLSVGLTILLLSIAVIKHSTTSKFAMSFIMSCLVGVLAPIWFAAMNWLVGLGTNLATWAQFYHPHDLVSLPNTNNPLGQIIALGAIFGVGSLVVLAFFAYSIVIVAVTFFGLPAMVLFPLGERARGFLNWIITLGLVSMVFGRPVAIVILEISKFLSDALANGNWFFETFILIGGFAMALIAQVILVVMLHTQVDKVTGAVKSQVTGTVNIIMPTGSRPGYSYYDASTRGNSGVQIHREAGKALKDAAIGAGIVAIAQGVMNLGLPGSGVVASAAHSMAGRRGVTKKATKS